MKWFLFILILGLSGCTKPEVDELREETPLLTAFLVAGENPSGVRLFTLEAGKPGFGIPVNGTIVLSDSTGENIALQQENGGYSSDQMVIQTSTEYRLEAWSGNHHLSSSISIPPPVSMVSISDDTVHLATPSSIAFFLTWTDLDADKYSYVLSMENLEHDQVPITSTQGYIPPFDGPQVGSFFIMPKTGFRYYGHHRLTVHAIDRELESVFFFDPSDLRGLLRNGPDNVTGGKGFVAGVSDFAIDIYVLD